MQKLMFGCFYFIVAVEKPVSWMSKHFQLRL